MQQLSLEQEFSRARDEHQLRIIQMYHKALVKRDIENQRYKLSNLTNGELEIVINELAKNFTKDFILNSSSDEILQEYDTAWEYAKELPYII